ncbi:MAG: hypothetical protein CMN28_14345 [Salinisphaeraceae bacterium]|nr:hypothetical protein [Salinisphaeraceae bacterium]
MPRLRLMRRWYRAPVSLAMLVAAMLCQPWSSAFAVDVAGLISEVSRLNAEVLAVEHRIKPFAVRQSYLYLALDDDAKIRRASLKWSAGAEPDVRFELTDGNGLLPELSRAPIQRVFTEPTPCSVTLVWVTDEGERSETRSCEIPAIDTNDSIELTVQRRWLRGPRIDLTRWPDLATIYPPNEQGEAMLAPVAELREAIAGLAKALDEAVGPRAKDSRSKLTGSIGSLPPDLRYEFHACREGSSAAMARLFRYRATYSENLPGAFWLGYGRCSLSQNLVQEAEVAYTKLFGLLAREQVVYELAWRIAEYYYSAGDLNEAMRWIETDPGKVPPDIESMWRDLQSRIYLSAGQPEHAANVLSSGRHLNVAGTSLELYEGQALHHVMRMNYAVALHRSGREDEAMSVLERVGTSAADNVEEQSLKARANAKLGWHFLSQGYGGSAVKVLHRIPLEGLYSDRALLGMGWAMLAPRGEAQPLVSAPGFDRAATDPPVTSLPALLRTGEIDCSQYRKVTGSMDCSEREEFLVDEFSDDETEQLKRALIYWHELIERDDAGAASLEATLAAANGHMQLGDLAASQRLYRQASDNAQSRINQLQALTRRLDAMAGITTRRDAQRLIQQLKSAYGRDLMDWKSSHVYVRLVEALEQTVGLEQELAWMRQSELRRTPIAPELGRLQSRLEQVRRQLPSIIIQTAQASLAPRIEDYRLYAAQAGLGVAQFTAVRP